MIDETTLYRIIGEKIRQFRGKKLTQQQLADRLQLKRTSITNIEAGNQKPPLHLLYRICEVLDLPISELLPAPEQVEATNVVETQTIVLGDKQHTIGRKTAAFIDSLDQKQKTIPPKTDSFIRKVKGEK